MGAGLHISMLTQSGFNPTNDLSAPESEVGAGTSSQGSGATKGEEEGGAYVRGRSSRHTAGVQCNRFHLHVVFSSDLFINNLDVNAVSSDPHSRPTL